MNTSILENIRTMPRIPSEVAALLSALQLDRPNIASLNKLSDPEWSSLLAFSDTAQLTLSIAQLPLEGFPDWVVERLKTNLADNALRFERIKATYREASAALERAGVEHVVIKGFTQAPDYVADPRLRSQSDIDIFCPPESIDDAQRALRAIGYEPSSVKISYALADHNPTLVRLGDWKWRGNPFDPEMPPSIELHFCLWNEHVSRIGIPETRLFWERRTMRMFGDFSYRCLSPVDQLGYFTLHILRNLFLREWIVLHVRELAAFLHSRADDDAFWRLWSDAHSPSLRSHEAIAFYYARAWFGCRLHPLARHEIDSMSATRKSLLHCFCGSALELMFHANKDSLWLHLSLLSSREEKWKVLRRNFIPASVGPIGVVPLQVRYKRLIQPRGTHRWQQYIHYMIARSLAFGRTNLATLRRGLRWRLSQHSFTR